MLAHDGCNWLRSVGLPVTDDDTWYGDLPWAGARMSHPKSTGSAAGYAYAHLKTEDLRDRQRTMAIAMQGYGLIGRISFNWIIKHCWSLAELLTKSWPSSVTPWVIS